MSSKYINAIFPTVFAHIMSLCHILVILKYFQLFHYYHICYKHKTSMDEELLPTGEQRKLFLEMKSIPDEDAVKIVEIATQNLEY